MDFKEQIAAYAAQIGIDKIGFAQATQTWQKDKYEEYLGVRPKNETEGVLQDVHWASGCGQTLCFIDR